MPNSSSDMLWLLVSTTFIILMQAGFLCLEAGLTRTKNSIHVATKKLVNFGTVILCFWLVGFGLIYGQSAGGWVGTSFFFPNFTTVDPYVVCFALFQMMFCVTSVAVFSGAIAERTRFPGFVAMVILAATVIYPVFSHWTSNGVIEGARAGWLGRLGFEDFAGGTYVHGVGGWISLAAILVIGPRDGRFDDRGKPRAIPGSDLPFAILGIMLFFLGWIGFNGGSLGQMNGQVPGVIGNTLIAGCAGMWTTLALSWYIQRKPDVIACMSGALAGLVAITPCAQSVSTGAALIIGGVGGLICVALDRYLLKKKIDDAVSAVPVHLGAGVWGTIAVGIFGDPRILHNGLGQWQQIGVQLLGTAVAGAWAFGVAYFGFRLIDRVYPLRVKIEDEQAGLNVSEHGARTEWLNLLTGMKVQADTKNWSLRIQEEPYTDAGQIAHQYNEVLDAFEKATVQLEASSRMASIGTMAAGIAHEINNPLAVIQGRSDQLRRFALKEKLDQKMLVELSDDIQTTTGRIAGIIRSLRNIAGRDKSGPQEQKFAALLIQDTLILCAERFRHAGIELRVGEIPAGLSLRCNQTELSQVLINLLNNAFDAVAEAPEKWVSLDVTEEGDAICFAVTDSGPGIPAELRDKILHPFFTTKEPGKGTGLGLYLAKSFVERHLGRLTLDASSPRTRFVVMIPRSRPAERRERETEQHV